MTAVIVDRPVGHRRMYDYSSHSPGHLGQRDRIDPGNYWKCQCGFVSRSWEAADRHTADEHEVQRQELTA